jgi:hypothetical protein
MMTRGNAAVLVLTGALATVGCNRRNNSNSNATMQPGVLQPGMVPGQPIPGQPMMAPGVMPGQPIPGQPMMQPGMMQPGVAQPGMMQPTMMQQPMGQPGAAMLNENATPNFGVRAITPGFTPDPMDIQVVSGGNLDARALSLGPGCVGYVTSQPDFNIQLSAPDNHLRLYVTSNADTTLVVNDAAGRWFCNDDSHGGDNPTVDLTSTPAGLINVWIGSYQSGVQARGILHITELDSNHP